MLCLFLLKTWRDLHAAQMEQFPTELSLETANHIAIHFSNCKTYETGYAAWEESLQLYLHMIRNASSSSRSGIQSLRHTILITLLDHNQWQHALHFFNHSLSQNDMPNHKSVGYLSQHLGEQGQWRAVLLLFEMCVKLLCLRSKVNCSTSPLKEDRIARDWGTTISMIMRAVAKHNPSQIKLMLNCIIATPQSGRTPDSPLVKLDGNFLSAVESLSQLSSRQEVIRTAREANLLDYYKLIRGLSSIGKASDALAVFVEGLQNSPPRLNKKEIGKARLHILHATSFEESPAIVSQLNAVGFHRSSLHLNDAEVECILAKSLRAMGQRAQHCRSGLSFWEYSLKLLEANYPHLFSGPEVLIRRRWPSIAALTFTLRNRQIPWEIALRLASHVDKYEHGIVKRESTSPEVLLLTAAAQLLYDQGQYSRADSLSEAAIADYNASPSAIFLQQCSISTLEDVILTRGVAIDNRVLHYVLSQKAEPTARPLVVVSLLMKKRSGALWDPPTGILPETRGSGGGAFIPWLHAVPASVHCGVLRYIRECRYFVEPSKCSESIRAYWSYLFPSEQPAPSSHAPASSHMLDTFYCTTYEAVVSLLSLSERARQLSSVPESPQQRRATVLDMLEACTHRYGYLPPSHMLLPNQVDRMLPRLQYSQRAIAVDELWERKEASKILVKCCYDRLLRSVNSPTASQPLEPVVFHSLGKLCCRIGEYEAYLATAADPGSLPFSAEVPLSEIASQLLVWQCEKCGLGTMRAGSLMLLYTLCHAQGGRWDTALKTTGAILEQERALRKNSLISSSPLHDSAVRISHYEHFRDLFGWERGLRVWYHHFPRQVLTAVSGHGDAIRLCLQLSDG